MDAGDWEEEEGERRKDAGRGEGEIIETIGNRIKASIMQSRSSIPNTYHQTIKVQKAVEILCF